MHYEAKEYASPPRTRHTQKMWRESLRSCYTIARMHYEAKEYASHPHTHHTHSVVISVFNNQRVIIINGDKQLLSTEV